MLLRDKVSPRGASLLPFQDSRHLLDSLALLANMIDMVWNCDGGSHDDVARDGGDDEHSPVKNSPMAIA